MFEKFGEFDTYEEMNLCAEGLKNEGDEQSLYALAKENGIDVETVYEYLTGEFEEFTTPVVAAIGKIDIEAAELKLPANILIYDWVNQIKTYLMEDEAIARAVRKKGKTLAGCIGAIMKAAFSNQWQIPKEITKAADISASRVTFGVPSAAGVNWLIKKYYTEGGDGEKE